MRYYEFNQNINEAEARKSSHLKRYSSELGLLFGLTGDPSREFDPSNPEASISSSMLSGADTYAAIKKEAHLFEEAMFRKWAAMAPKIKDGITQRLGYFPSKMSWVATKSDDENAADIKFEDPACNGISVKDGGTLANLSASQYGIPMKKGVDTFKYIGGETYDKWKDDIFMIALSKAKDRPGEKIQTHSKFVNDYIMYDPNSDEFILSTKGEEYAGSLNEILRDNDKNASWQRPVGSWLQNNFGEPDVQAASRGFLSKLQKAVVQGIEKSLSNSEKISHICRIPDKSLFYVSPSALWFMKGKREMPPMVLKDVVYTGPELADLPEEDNLSEAEGSSPKLTQTFKIFIGPDDSDESAALRLCLYYPHQPFVGNMGTRLFPASKKGEKSTFEVIGWELVDDNVSGKYASPEATSQVQAVRSDLQTHAEDFIERAKAVMSTFDAAARKNKINAPGMDHLRAVNNLIAAIEKNLNKRLKQSDVDPTKAQAADLIAQANNALYQLQKKHGM